MRPDDLCPEPPPWPDMPTPPLTPPLATSLVYRCESPAQADRLLGAGGGYVYRRNGHPNGDQLAEKCRRLHGAEQAVVAGCGTAALTLAALAVLEPGDRVLLGSPLYGGSEHLLASELARWGVAAERADPTNLDALRAACQRRPRLVVIETISNPLVRAPDLAAVADIVHAAAGLLLVDNTFATPIHCRPLEWGADLVLESLSKFVSGHADVLVGALCGNASLIERASQRAIAWGLVASPFDCWLALRGVATLHLRVDRASANAQRAAEMLAEHPAVAEVFYPGLASHPDHAVAARQLAGGFGPMLSFRLRGGLAAAERFIAAAAQCIPFCPSLGDVSTTLSHPASTSHRGMTPEERARAGIDDGLIRLSVGCESAAWVCESLAAALG